MNIIKPSGDSEKKDDGIPIDPFDELPGLLEQYMEETGGDQRWVTVQEFRDRFHLSRERSHIIAAFFSRLMYQPLREFPFVVRRVERIKARTRSQITPNQYLVKRR